MIVGRYVGHLGGILVCCALVACSGPASQPKTASVPDLGIYADAPRFSDLKEHIYHGVLSKVFADSNGTDATGCFNMVSIADDRPEEMVYVNCRADSAEVPVLLVHLVAEESVADKLRASGIDAAQQIKARRTESTLDARDARVLRDAWLRMLEHPRVRTGTPLHETRRAYSFSAMRTGVFQGRVGGVAQNPRVGTPAADLVQIGNLLSALADSQDASTAEAASLRSTIRARAQALLKNFSTDS